MRSFLLAPSLESRPLPTWRQLLIVVFGNTLIAGLFWATGSRWNLAAGWITAQCMGLSICTVAIAANYYTRPWLGRFGWMPGLLVGVLVGLPLGLLLAYGLGFGEALREVQRNGMIALRYLMLGVLFTLLFWYYFRSRVRIVELEQAHQAAELRQAQVQKTALQAELRLLQAQIEPHFLFNTLANLHSLIGRDDAAARGLLERLNDYLRASLAHSRSARATLGDECAMLKAYLEIQAQRTGGRLRYALEVAPELQALEFPPMLLQPLVENAVVHGIEPKLGEGRILIRARRAGAALEVEVADDGVGLGAARREGRGVGLTNVRERLAALYGSGARLSLVEKPAGGVSAELCIPLEGSEGEGR